ncbi:MAG: peptide ABC transporter permease, partial [Actinomycetota bacterium]|nr:peptide ABC transporter permease [Actinomycetota bacterium]
MLLGVSVVVFAMVRAIPGDPAQILLGQAATPDQVADVRARLGLDQPLITQYLLFIRGALT